MITIVATPKKKINKETALELFKQHHRIRVVCLQDGFLANASLFTYARDLGNLRGDMYEIAVWEEAIAFSGNDIIFAINIPQEAVVIPETISDFAYTVSGQRKEIKLSDLPVP